MIRKKRPETLVPRMEITFVTGKGGVGKSAVAAAFAWSRAEAGKRTILVELGERSFYKDYFALPAVTYKGQNLRKNLDVARWSGLESLHEYALYLLKVETLYRLFIENSVSTALINTAPGLSELAIVGKITSGPPRNVGPKLPYDCVVVDAFASGHFMALLRAPQGMASAVRIGPMGEQSRSIDRALKDAHLCHYYVVTTPEELPVVEGIELANDIQETLGLKPTLLLNRLAQFDGKCLSEPPGPLKDFQDHLVSLDERQRRMKQTLQKTGLAVQELPWVLENDPFKVVKKLAEVFSHD